MMMEMHNPADMPDTVRIDHLKEPWIEATILVPDEYLGSVLKLCQDRRGRQKNLTYVGARAMLVYELPLNEVVFDFYDRLKSVSRGYASFDYHIIGYEEGDLVKLSILVNAEPVDALSIIVHRTRAEARGRAMCEKLKELIPPHLFQIPIQAAIGAKIIARETIRALRKDVIAKCYGGDMIPVAVDLAPAAASTAGRRDSRLAVCSAARVEASSTETGTKRSLSPAAS
jgi:GTP-binding protein LepA